MALFVLPCKGQQKLLSQPHDKGFISFPFVALYLQNNFCLLTKIETKILTCDKNRDNPEQKTIQKTSLWVVLKVKKKNRSWLLSKQKQFLPSAVGPQTFCSCVSKHDLDEV